MDTLLYDLSIPAINSLQNKLHDHANLMQLLSVVFDPKYAFLIYSPIAYLVDHKLGKRLILTTVVAEWLNQVLKWFLHGERPYWYVHSSGHFDPQQLPIQQFPITCELGPGHPSGHAMVTAAVWYIILSFLLNTYQTCFHRRSTQTKTLRLAQATSSKGTTSTILVWTMYASLLALVSVSRVFLGCHFPHQCLAGAILGLLVAKFISSLNTKPLHFVETSVFLFVTAFGTFGVLQALGLDPSWTIKLATKHCVKREYIHLDTAPFFSIMRYCGFALGCGLGLLYPIKGLAQRLAPIVPEGEILVDENSKSHPLSSKDISWLSAKILMALVMARLVDSLGLFISHSNLSLFYSAAFLAYTLFSYALVNL